MPEGGGWPVPGGFAEVEVVENAQELLSEKQASGDLVIPAGLSYAATERDEAELRRDREAPVARRAGDGRDGRWVRRGGGR